MRLQLISGGSVGGTGIVDSETGDPLRDVIGFTLERGFDADHQPLPYMLLNLTVRIEDEAETPEPDADAS